MIAWTINSAIESKNSICFVSTIVKKCQQAIGLGAEIILMKKFNDDYSTVSEATLYTLKKVKFRISKKYKTIKATDAKLVL